MLRRLARFYIPAAARLAFARVRYGIRDSLSGDARRLARRRGDGPWDCPEYCVAEVVQQIRGTAFAEGKKENIRIGAERLDGVKIVPGGILSFWTLVGPPTAAAGFRIGRSIRGGVAVGDVGGGLCQVSGIAYELGLRAGLEPIERHPHSRDLYAEEERFTPLGLDATIAWPRKDLRLRNSFDVPVTIRIVTDGATLQAALYAPRPIEPMTIEIERTDHAYHRAVRVRRRRAGTIAALVSDDSYPFAPHA